MGSTFMGLETAKRGITAQRAGLYVTSNNVSNANTDGYSRQRELPLKQRILTQ